MAVRDASVQATEVVLQVHGGDDGANPQGAAATGFALEGERIQLDWYNVTHQFLIPYVGAMTPDPSVSSGNETEPRVSNSPKAHGTATWNHTRVALAHIRDEPIFFLAGLGTILGDGPTVSLDGHDVQEVEEQTGFDTGREAERRAVASLHQTTTPRGVVTVHGDFLLAVYSWDLRFTNATAEETYRSGRWNTDDRAAAGGLEEQNLYLHVTNGTLTLPLDGLNVQSFYLGATSLDAANAVLKVVGQDTVNIDGPLRLALEPVVDGTFDAALAPVQDSDSGPGPSSLDATPGAEDSLDLAPSGAVAEPEPARWPLWLLIPVALVALALVAWRVLRVLRLRQMMQAGQYGEVAASSGMEESRAFGSEVVLARVVALVKTNDLDGAAALMERHGGRLLPSVSAYLWACVHAGRGDEEEARSFVVKTIMADPSMAVEVASNGKLRGFLSDLDWEGYS